MARLSPLDPWHPNGPERHKATKKWKAHNVDVRGFGTPMQSSHGLTWRRDFNSVVSMFQHFNKAWAPTQPSTDYDGNPMTWSNTYRHGGNWGETERLVMHGWPDGAKYLQRETRALLNYTTKLVQRPEPRRDVVGEYYDIGAYMSGQPNYWVRHDPVMQRGKERNGPVRLVIQHATSMSTDHATMYRKGAIALTLATLLERAGRPTEIIAADAGYWKMAKATWYLFWTTRVKAMSQPLNFATMAFAILHPYMERVLYLGAGNEARYAFRDQSDGGHLGCVMNVPVGDASDTITLDYNPYGAADPDQISAYVKRVLSEQGITLTGD